MVAYFARFSLCPLHPSHTPRSRFHCRRRQDRGRRHHVRGGGLRRPLLCVVVIGVVGSAGTHVLITTARTGSSRRSDHRRAVACSTGDYVLLLVAPRSGERVREMPPRVARQGGGGEQIPTNTHKHNRSHSHSLTLARAHAHSHTHTLHSPYLLACRLTTCWRRASSFRCRKRSRTARRSGTRGTTMRLRS